MKKGSIITLSIIGILVFVFLLFQGRFGGNEFSIGQSSQIIKDRPEPKSNIGESDLDGAKYNMGNDASRLAVSELREDAVRSSNSKMDYESDWCIATSDLDPVDISYFNEEVADWRLTRGQVIPAIKDEAGNEYSSGNSQYLAPYIESNYEDLWIQIRNDNEFAMMAALNREDIDINSQLKISQRLVVKGHTGLALSNLVIIELTNAKMAYSNTGKINADIEGNLYRALAYTAYGIEQYDLNAAFSFLRIVSSEEFPIELKPVYSLGRKNSLPQYTHELKELIDNSRVDENMILPVQNEVPKAAKHDFENMLARLYIDYEREFDNLKLVLSDSTSKMLESSDCVKKQVEMFASAKRK
tara:strand:- start:262 stop:1332 length:1071 start_codon:yes stop_codon:yes gene_type:complete